MENKYFYISMEDRETIIVSINDFLKRISGLKFAYVHGSFIGDEKFHDIDVAAYLELMPDSALQIELDLETEISKIIVEYPIDVRILNVAPLSFRYNVIKDGKAVAVNDDDARSDFEEATLSNYFDFAPFRKLYLQEALDRGV
jgi:hypothetical protein